MSDVRDDVKEIVFIFQINPSKNGFDVKNTNSAYMSFILYEDDKTLFSCALYIKLTRRRLKKRKS